MRKFGYYWDDDQLEEMRKLYVDENKTASEVAKALSLASRNVVLRQAQKRGWQHHEPPPKPPKPVKEPRRRPPPKRAPPPIVAQEPARPARPVPFLSRRFGQCAWILVEGAAPMCCGQPTVTGSSWCPAHYKRAFQPKKSRAA